MYEPWPDALLFLMSPLHQWTPFGLIDVALALLHSSNSRTYIIDQCLESAGPLSSFLPLPAFHTLLALSIGAQFFHDNWECCTTSPDFPGISSKLLCDCLWTLFQLPFGIITQYYLQYNSYWSQLFSVNDPQSLLEDSQQFLGNFGSSLNIPGSNQLLALQTCAVRPRMACGPLLHGAAYFVWFLLILDTRTSGLFLLYVLMACNDYNKLLNIERRLHLKGHDTTFKLL